MATSRLDAILLTEGTSLNYFTGIRWWGGERLFAAVLPAKGPAFYVCPAFEEGRAREQIANGADVIAAWTQRDQLRASLIDRISGYDAVLTFAAAGCFTVMLAMTLALNMPINLAIFRWDEEHGDPARWRQLRRRWDLIHTGRILLDSAGFALIATAVVWY